MNAGFPVSPGAAIAGALRDAGYTLRLRGCSALDSYLGLKKPLPFVQAETSADIAVLARLFEGLRFPGVDLADAALETRVPQANAAEGQTWYFRCGEPGEPPSYALLSLTQDWHTRHFYDPAGLYPLLRALKGKPLKAAGEGLLSWPEGLDPQAGYYRALMDGALILARYGEGPPGTRADRSAADISAGPVIRPLLQALQTAPKDPPPRPEAQRLLLTGLLVSLRPDWGLEFLKAAGFVDAFWPELARLDQADHAKEYHPEGNAWNHTLETFRYR
jgi:poly(A) polymerase